MSQTEDNRIIIAFDATELDNFDSCHRQWNLFHHRRVVPKSTKAYLEVGSLLHYLLELYYNKKKTQSLISQGEIEEIIEAGRIKSLEFNLQLDEIGEIIFQFREYHRYYSDEVEETIIPIHAEQPFIVQLHEDDDMKVYITGKPDLIFKYHHGGEDIVMDHKKISRESEMSPIRNQFMLYATAMKTDTVVVNKIGFQKTKKPRERFLRQVFVYPQESLDEWKSDVIDTAREMIIAEKFKLYKPNRTSCEKWDGCFYKRYCATRPSAREFLIGDGREFIIREEWDPSLTLEKSKEKKENG